jgi:hypothetical protein
MSHAESLRGLTRGLTQTCPCGLSHVHGTGPEMPVLIPPCGQFKVAKGRERIDVHTPRTRPRSQARWSQLVFHNMFFL